MGGAMADDHSLELLSEVLDKLIETQIQSAQATSDLKNAVQDNNEHLRELHRLLADVNDHFTNGFRQEIREHINEAVEALEEQLSAKAEEGKKEAQSILKSLQEFIDAIKSPKSWISAFLFIGSIVGMIAGIVTVILKLMGGP
jgi:ABC-type transporter Mla subunit MlaD